MKDSTISNVLPIVMKKSYKNGKPVEIAPVNQVYNVELPGGLKVKLAFEHSTDIIMRRAKIYGRVVRLTNKKPAQFPVEVRATKLTLKITGATNNLPVQKKTFHARSCCKPPDVFSTLTGRLYALRHLFRNPAVRDLFSSEDKQALIKACKVGPKIYAQRQNSLTKSEEKARKQLFASLNGKD